MRFIKNQIFSFLLSDLIFIFTFSIEILKVTQDTINTLIICLEINNIARAKKIIIEYFTLF